MTSFPLPTWSCTIDANGISAPVYADILTDMQIKFRNLYGADVDLDADTQDGQWLAILAAGYNDSNNATIAAFNAQSPTTAQGTGLSSVVKINGLEREASSNSTVDVTIVGTAGTRIQNGIVGDNQNLNTKWTLFSDFIIPDSGTVIVTATCTTPGAVQAEVNTINQILTPTLGWQTANNATSAFPGSPVEVDAPLRQRQGTSQNVPSQTPASATKAAIDDLSGVARSTYVENDTGGVDPDTGVPAYSIAFVVGGGDVMQIAQTIQRKKTIGTPTYGTTTETVFDPAGVPININFYVLELQDVTVQVNIDALVGYSDTTALMIQQAVSNYISALPIGGTVYLNKVEAIASLVTFPVNVTFEITSLTLNMAGLDVTVPFYKAATCAVSDVTVTVG